MAGELRQAGWWQRLNTLPARYVTFIAYEAEATELRHYEPTLIPGLLQTRAYAEEVVKVRPGAMEAAGSVQHPSGVAQLPRHGAEGRPSSLAELAAAAGGPEEHDDVVAGSHRGDSGADLFDDAGALMAEDAGERDGQIAVHEVVVAVADAGGRDPDQDLPMARPVELDLLNPQRLFGLVKDHSLHSSSPPESLPAVTTTQRGGSHEWLDGTLAQLPP